MTDDIERSAMQHGMANGIRRDDDNIGKRNGARNSNINDVSGRVISNGISSQPAISHGKWRRVSKYYQHQYQHQSTY